MSEFPLSIVTPQGTAFEQAVNSVNAPGVEGSFGILAKHTPMLALLKEGILKLKKSGKEIFFAIGKGVLEVNQNNAVLILSDRVIECEDLQQAKNRLADLN